MNERHFLVRLAVDNAIELDVAVLHRDADGLSRVNGVPLENWVVIDRAGHGHASLVVHDRYRIDLDFVLHFPYAWIGADQRKR